MKRIDKIYYTDGIIELDKFYVKWYNKTYSNCK